MVIHILFTISSYGKKYGLNYSRYFYETCLLNFISHKILLLLDKAVLGKISVLDFSCLLDN